MAKVKPVPDGYPQVSPYLCIDGASDAIDFYSRVLGAKERMRMPGPDGTLGHAELDLGDSVIMLADEITGSDVRSPKAYGGTPVTISVYVDDVDRVLDDAAKHGATVLRSAENQFYGDRTASFEDPWGHHWHLATHVEDVTPDEMAKRMAEMMGGNG